MPRSFTPHTIRVRIPDAEYVSVVGDFNNWHSAAHPLVQVAPDVWERIVDLPPGEHKVAFFVFNRAAGGTPNSRVVADDSAIWSPEPGAPNVRIIPHPTRRISNAA